MATGEVMRIGRIKMATREQIRQVLTSPDFTEGEKFVIRMQFRHAIQAGNFEEKLWELLCAADGDNLIRIAIAFPVEAQAFDGWAHGDLGNRIRAAGCPI